MYEKIKNTMFVGQKEKKAVNQNKIFKIIENALDKIKSFTKKLLFTSLTFE